MLFFRFAYPWVLMSAAIIYVATLFMRLSLRTQTTYKYPLTSIIRSWSNNTSQYKPTVMTALRAGTLACCVLLAARPQWVDQQSKIRVDGIDIVLALDISGSMQIFDDLRDRRPRISVAKSEAIKFIEKRHNDPIGVVVFGAETVSIVVFENNIPISLKVFSIGGTDITNDIALGLKIPLDEAERVKTGALSGVEFPRRKLDEIIGARLTDIFELIEAHLKKIGKNGLLPAGIIITGGGSGIATTEDLARAALKLPSKTSAGFGNGNNGSITVQGQVRDSSWAVAYGLCIWGLSTEESGVGIKLAKQTSGSVIQWIKQFLP